MRTIHTIIQKTALSAANVAWAETENLSDIPAVNPTLPEAANASDVLGPVAPALPDTVNASDAYLATMTAGQATSADKTNLSDSPVASLATPDTTSLSELPTVAPALPDTTNLSDAPAASLATPDTTNGSDRVFAAVQNAINVGDTYVDQLAANAGTNFGTLVTMLAKGDTNSPADLSNEQQAWVKFDFTKFAGLSVRPGGSHSVTFRGSATTSVVLTLSFSVTSSSPWGETTLTWNNKPARTVSFTKTVTVNSATGADFTVTLADSNVTALLGNWATVVCTTPAGTVPTTVTIDTKESALQTSFFRFSFELQGS